MGRGSFYLMMDHVISVNGRMIWPMASESWCMIVETCICFDFILSYEGEWKKGKANGTGTYTTSNVTYEGEWLADKQHGLGKEIWRAGDVYEGDFLFGMK